jgi:hypothetical protein
MTNEHPITPPPELVQRLSNSPESWLHQITNAYQAGADMQFEACGKAIKQAWEMDHVESVDDLLREFRAACRPKPPSLKEQALAVLDDCANCLDGAHENTIRRALEALDD